MISRVATSLPLLFDVRWSHHETSEPLPSPLVDPKCVSQLECSIDHMLVEKPVTRRLSREVFCSTAWAMLAASNNLNVYRRQRVDPQNLDVCALASTAPPPR